MSSFSNSNSSSPSILVIGATGKTGLAIINELGKDPSQPKIFAMARSPSKLNGNGNVEAVYKGDARSQKDIENALAKSKASWVVVSVGNGEDVSKSDIRSSNAKATVAVLKKPAFAHVRAMVVSSTGAGSSKIIVGFGIGRLISFHLRHVLSDHTKQEAYFKTVGTRATVSRFTALTDDAPVGKLVEFGDTAKSPTIKTDREDVAKWMTNEMCGHPTKPRGGFVNLTGVAK